MGMFVFLLLISKYSLYILENNPLSGVCFANIFLPACGLFLTLLIFFFFFFFFFAEKVINTKTSEFGTQKDLL